MTETQRDLVLHLLKEGDWQEAMIAYSEETGASPEEARDAVTRLAEQCNLKNSSRRRMWVFAAMASAIGLVAGLLFVY